MSRHKYPVRILLRVDEDTSTRIEDQANRFRVLQPEIQRVIIALGLETLEHMAMIGKVDNQDNIVYFQRPESLPEAA